MKKGFTLGLAACLVLLAGSVHAQARYMCRGANGGVIVSDRPCVNEMPLQGRDPAPVYRPPPPSIGEAPAYITHMSPRCASLHDALRTAHARGLKPETVTAMRREYQGECGEDERDASRAWSQAQGEKRSAQREQLTSQRRAVDEAKANAERCGESKRILAVKKRRTDLNEGERADLARFEENVRARCG
jgi:hypothetical protein